MIWDGPPQPARTRLDARGWLRVVRRGAPLAVTVFGGLALLLLIRLLERPVFGQRRPVTPWITQGVCRAAFFWLGLARGQIGQPTTHPGAAVANHASWLDIFALNAGTRLYFVSKSEVAGWPGIGWLARATGTVFIERDRRHAAQQAQVFVDRLRAGHRLTFFPEGTSTDGRRILPFKPTLFAAFQAEGLGDLVVQPITISYHAPPGERPDFYGWWGDRGFGDHLLAVLAAPRHGRVELRYHAPLAVADHWGRKALAAALERSVRAGMPPEVLAAPSEAAQ